MVSLLLLRHLLLLAKISLSGTTAKAQNLTVDGMLIKRTVSTMVTRTPMMERLRIKPAACVVVDL